MDVNEGEPCEFNDRWQLRLSLLVGSDREWWGLGLTRELMYRAQLPCSLLSLTKLNKACQFVTSGVSKGESKLMSQCVVSVSDCLMDFVLLLFECNCALRFDPLRGSAVGTGTSMALSHAYMNS